jgi:hypothetical protein
MSIAPRDIYLKTELSFVIRHSEPFKTFTNAELKTFDGSQPDGRFFIAVNGLVYDVTSEKRFYGPGETLCCNDSC